MQIGNNSSKSEASIQSRTALNDGEMENLVTDQFGSSTAKRTQRFAKISGYRNKFETKMSLTERKRNRANHCFLYYSVVSNRKGWYSTGHGSHTPPQDDGDKSMMDLAQSLQTLDVHALADLQTWYVRR